MMLSEIGQIPSLSTRNEIPMRGERGRFMGSKYELARGILQPEGCAPLAWRQWQDASQFFLPPFCARMGQES
jgi:hypothetical protein